MTEKRFEDPLWLWAAIGGLAIALFAADLTTPPAIEVWIFSSTIVVLCSFFTWKPLAPVAVAVALSTLAIVGYFFQGTRSAELEKVVLLNRGFGVARLLLIGVMGHWFVIFRVRVATEARISEARLGLSRCIRGEQTLNELGKNILATLGEYVDARVGAMYVANSAGSFERCAGFAAGRDLDGDGLAFGPGEGLIGQAAVNARLMVVDDVPAGYVEVRSGVGNAPPRSLVLVPTHAEGGVNGVVEFGFFSAPDAAVRGLLDSVAETIGFAVQSAAYRTRQAELLEEAQCQTEELQAQQEELMQMNEELQQQTQRLEEVQTGLEETLRDNEIFAAVLAHDLRNPLSAMLAGTQLVLHLHGEHEAIATPLHRVVSSGKRMSRMIDQLLDFTKARLGGGFELEPRDGDLAEICRLALGEVELGHPEWKVLVESVGDVAGAWDTDRLLQVVSNLVANAGQHGKPAAEIQVKVDGTRGDAVTLEVHNEGRIPEVLLRNIFSPFRGTGDRKAGSSGLGLGLYISQQIVRSHGGMVNVTSSESSGTTFRVRLPRRTGAANGESTSVVSQAGLPI